MISQIGIDHYEVLREQMEEIHKFWKLKPLFEKFGDFISVILHTYLSHKTRLFLDK